MVVMSKITYRVFDFLGFIYFCYNIISDFFVQGTSVSKSEEKIK